MESSETSNVFIRRKSVHMDRNIDGLRERVAALWQFKSLYMGHFFHRFPLANQLALPESESLYGISQDVPMYVCASSYPSWIPVKSRFINIPLSNFKEVFCAFVVGKVSLILGMKYMWFCLFIWAGLSLHYLYLSTGDKL